MKITRYRLFAVFTLLVFRVLAPVPVAAQSIATPYLGFIQSGLGGGPAAGGFPLSGLDHVDLMSGAMSLRIPLLQIGGRGAAGFTMFYTVTSPWAVSRRYQDLASLHTCVTILIGIMWTENTGLHCTITSRQGF